MMRKVPYYILSVIVILPGLLLFASCDLKSRTSCNIPEDEYLSYDSTGFIRKYFDKDFKEVHYKSKASYYREAYYVDGEIVKDSIAKDYYITGEKQFEGYILSESPDILIGKGIWFYKNGKIESIKNADKAGKLQGECIEFFENGNRKSVYTCKDDQLNGKYTRYFLNGKVSFVYHYKNDERDGLCTEYYENGQVSSIYSHMNGKQHGATKEFYPNGKLKSTANCKYGSYEGIVRLYYENGKIKEIRTYKNNECNGEYKTYYENGRLQSKGIALNGKKVGIWEYYDTNGYVSYRNESTSSTLPNYTSGGGSARSNYAALWDECEILESVLDEHNIDHECLSYPMDYLDLEDLRDEYKSLLEDNDIDY